MTKSVDRTVAARMRKYRAKKSLRSAIHHALCCGLTGPEVSLEVWRTVTQIRVTADFAAGLGVGLVGVTPACVTEKAA